MTALALQTISTVTRPNLSISFLATGGTSPYTFSVIAGGAGGTINSSSGIYTAPAVYGQDVVQVADSASPTPATATAVVSIGSPIQLVCDIIQNQMGLANGQVYLYNQKIDIPIDSQLYIAVGVLSCKPFGNTNRPDGSGSALNADQSVNIMETLSIDILSRGLDALNRKEEVLMALLSNYAQYQMNANSFFVAPISSAFVNLSEVDGAAIPYRFNISVNLHYAVTKTVAVGYLNNNFTPTIITNP